MRLHRFFATELFDSPIGQKREVSLSDHSLLHQLKHVFRLHAGDSVVLLDNSGSEYVSQIVSLEKSEGVFRITETMSNKNVSPFKVMLYQSIPKKDTFEWILQKDTELGVLEFVPVLSDRSEKKGLNEDRCKRILLEASEQSGRTTLPSLQPITSLEEAIEAGVLAGVSLVAFHLSGEQWNAKKFLSDLSAQNGSIEKDEAKKIGLLIGPEGGWTDTELELFASKHIPVFSLGSQVLRAETAAVVAAASVLLSL